MLLLLLGVHDVGRRRMSLMSHVVVVLVLLVLHVGLLLGVHSHRMVRRQVSLRRLRLRRLLSHAHRWVLLLRVAYTTANHRNVRMAHVQMLLRMMSQVHVLLSLLLLLGMDGLRMRREMRRSHRPFE